MEDKEKLQKAVAEADILANATIVGMKPDLHEETLIPKEWMRKDLVVADIVYNPEVTRMLKEGYRVELDDLGIIYLTLGCEGAESRETFNPDKHIKEVRVNWAPGEAFENIREGITFEETIDRRTERKLLRMGRNEESKDGIILRRNRLTT